MKFREIFRFELSYQFKRISTWLFVGIFLLFGLGIVRAGSSDVPINAPSIIALFSVFAGAIWLIIGAAIAGDAAARDHETGMHPLMHSTPLSKANYLGGRFLAAFLINAFLLALVPAGMLLSTYLPGISPDERGPFRLAAYLTAYGFILLPNVFVATAIQFAAATRSRRAISAYLASLGILIVSHMVGAMVAQLFGNWDIAKAIDMLGLIGIIGSELETWTPIESRTRLISLEGVYLINRLLWVSAGLVVAGFTYKRFRFEHAVEGARRSWFGAGKSKKNHELKVPAASFSADSFELHGVRKLTATSEIADSVQHPGRMSVLQTVPTFGIATYLRQFAAIAWESFRTIAASKTGLSVVMIGALITALFMPEFMQFNGVPMLPTTERVIRILTAPLGNIQTPWIIIPLLTVFYAGELIWRERSAGVSEIADAAPVPESVLMLGKFVGIALILAAWMAILIAGGMFGQFLMDYREFEFSRYLQMVLGLQLVEYLLFALLVFVLQVVVNHKYLGHLTALIAYGLIAFAGWLGIQHNMLVYGSSPGWMYSDMRGYGPTLAPWAWFKLYWIAWAILLAVLAKVMWVRSREFELRARFALARSRMTGSTVGVVALATTLLLATGGFTFYNTNVLNTYHTSTERTEQRVEYERKYGKFERVPQPVLTSANLKVDIFPAQRAVNVKGGYRLVNNRAVAIDTIHVATMSAVTTGEITFDRAAKSVVTDDELGHRVYTLDTPLQPGDSLQLNFDVSVAPRGFSNSGYDGAVVANGTHFKNQNWFPTIGYQPQRQLTGDAERRKHGLGPPPRIPSLYDSTAPRDRADAEQVTVETVVSTDEGQIALAPGILTRSWSEGGRRYFHYHTDAPIGNEYAFFSAIYGVQKAQWKHVAIELYYHPRQKENVQRMVIGVQSALNYYTEKFGPYPFKIVRFVARPGPGVGMHADASTIDYSEGAATLNPNPRRRSLDLISMVVAHEVAHQWWGTQVSPAYVEGAGLLGEGLANYSALMVTEKTFGAEQVGYLLSMWRQMYEEPRSRASTPLLQAVDQFTSYRKGPFAIYTLSQHIGTDAVNVALRRVVEKYGSGKPPLPTSLDLFAELKAVTPDSLRYLLHDLFEANTFWSLTTDEVSMRESAPGMWEVTLNVWADKNVVDTAGVETKVPMNDWVEIGVFAAGQSSKSPLYLEKHRLRSGKQTITVTVLGKPDRAGIDPRYLLLGRAMDNNVKTLNPRKPGPEI